MTDEVTRLRAENGRLREKNTRLLEALRPFARIKPSSLYSADGSIGEKYVIFVEPPWSSDYVFTGADLARARAEMGEE